MNIYIEHLILDIEKGLKVDSKKYHQIQELKKEVEKLEDSMWSAKADLEAIKDIVSRD